MPAIHRITLERDNDTGVHEIKSGERLEPVEPDPSGESPGTNKQPPADERPQKRDEKRDEKRDKKRDEKREPPARENPPRRAPGKNERAEARHDKDEFERATTPFPGG